MKNLVTRSLSGIVYIAVIVGALLAGEWPLAALCILLGVLALNEVLNLCCGLPESTVEYLMRGVELLTVAVMILALVFTPWHCHANDFSAILFPAFWFLAILIVTAGVLLRLVMAVFDTSGKALHRCAYAIFGYCYIALPLAALFQLSQYGEGPYDYRIPLILFIMIWLNDTGAYCVGSTMGHNRLCERLSPKKSWEGFWGGLVFAMGGGICYALCCCPGQIALWAGAGAGAIVGVAATIGDLFESLIKRTAGVKDSGRLIPGHGGILDRIDSLLFAAPVLLLYYMFVR